MMPQDPIAEITKVVETYITSMVAGDRAGLERVFFENASEVGHFDGELLWNDREALIGMCEEAADGSAPGYWAIRNLSVHGDIAVAHVEDDWAGMRFDDLITLLHHDGAWRIVSKVYRVQRG